MTVPPYSQVVCCYSECVHPNVARHNGSLSMVSPASSSGPVIPIAVDGPNEPVRHGPVIPALPDNPRPPQLSNIIQTGANGVLHRQSQPNERTATSLERFQPPCLERTQLPRPEPETLRSTRPSSSRPEPDLCVVCKRAPQYSKGGKHYPTCGLTCAAKLEASSTSQLMCLVCGVRPRHFNGITTYPTCGNTCAARLEFGRPSDKGLGNKPQPTRDDGVPSVTNSSCLMCWRAREQDNSDFCGSACLAAAEQRAPLLLEVPKGHVTFHRVAQHFKNTWGSKSPCPVLVRVYKVVESHASFTDYQNFRRQVEASGHLLKLREIVSRRWHGARRECHLGDPGHEDLCSSETCMLCLTIRTSFSTMLFDKGIPTWRSSSQSDIYVKGNGRASLEKTMLLADVIPGREIELESHQILPGGIPDYDSVRVISKSASGRIIDRDELIVFSERAIRPLFLVVYR